MKQLQRPINEPFDVTYTISFSGRMKSDGVSTVTAQMIRDNIISVLENMIAKGYVRDYTVSAMVNNIEQARKTMNKSRKK